MKRVYVFVRTDIPIADQLVQIAHSCLLAGGSFKVTDKTYVVMCQIEEEEDLFDIAVMLDEKGVKHEMFYEPCNASSNCLGWTSLATEPTEMIEHSKIKLWTSKTICDKLKELLIHGI